MQTQQTLFKPFNYELITKGDPIKQDQWSYALAFNVDCSILVAGCSYSIRVFEVKNGTLEEIQVLNEHKGYVNTLNFFKKSPLQFISSDADSNIILWKSINNKEWKCEQKLLGHTSSIWALIINKEEDLIISSGLDKRIKFWTQQNQEWICFQTIDEGISSHVYSLSLNESQTQLISCNGDSTIFIIEKQKQNEWQITQKLKTTQAGYRVCFINEKIFTFQPKAAENLEVYEKKENGEFVKSTDVSVQGANSYCRFLFPQQFINQKSLLISKNGSYLNFIRYYQNNDQTNEFKLEQSIDFGSDTIGYLYGHASDDGKYLAIWNGQSLEFQIYQYKENEQ
ncbi:unnamed protein product (macronuclear) [Paramecium tetraurelia]|uniref:Uncharacterized protein n=1 Tax=Paramecium tetraurelia TaxID=5888 RepID=A0BT89_PARTE|nr:uncharacterized protein GSPATT00031988001 [Paramecium tetraurelia]CAK61756.1 unnamed protein product [Paramecium tetraurelia]|eukprot:XP_001429154.1 hypothetical protein (macronuclear) [Paramecium tetraurelia strain d4-2]